jgi:pyrimidine-nucleoside phosphorylase
MVDILEKKRHAAKLTGEEIAFFVRGYTAGEIPDYQAAAFAMAICFAGMDSEETAALTLAMAQSGEMVDLSSLPGIKVDKHSTGGVGDKTTLIVGPIVAALGVTVAKMSGRGLGVTGGTVDKLESIPGYRTALSREEFFACVRRAGIGIAGQSGNLAPADKKLYALRDVTATVDSIPLIAASIMSKKLAAGADAIVLDVKVGSGAFLKTLEEARILAREMVAIGERAGRTTVALLTDMDAPLGLAVGNDLEVTEALEVLYGRGPADVRLLSVELAANMLHLAGKGELSACRVMAAQTLRSGAALAAFRRMVVMQGGDPAYVDDPTHFPPAPLTGAYNAPRDGFITRMDAGEIGKASMLLGAGRREKDDEIDHSAGILFQKKPGDRVTAGEMIAIFHTSNIDAYQEVGRTLGAAIAVGPESPPPRPLLYSRISMQHGEILEEKR